MFLRKQFFITAFVLAAVSTLGLWFNALYTLALWGVMVFAFLCLVDVAMLLFCRVKGERIISKKLDLGENNNISLKVSIDRGVVRKYYAVDDIPSDLGCDKDLISFKKDEDDVLVAQYNLFPLRRGAYVLGRTVLFGSFLGFVERRFTVVDKGQNVDVYPAFSRLREKEQIARSLQVESYGSHKRQMPSHQTEFQDIREYVPGDDIRTVNWKATARVGRTMVNNFEDERSQHIYNIIDCGRTMHRTFGGLTLQDYAVNASLLLSYTALNTEGDNVGLMTYGPDGTSYLPSRSGDVQLKNIMQNLYSLKTEYGEGDLEELCLVLDRRVLRRSLVCLYTDYSSLASLDRQLPFLRRISQRHCLVVVLFLDRELESLSERKFERSEDEKKPKLNATRLVESTLASDLIFGKQSIIDKLHQNGIHSVATYPENLSFSIVRKYIDLKARQAW